MQNAPDFDRYLGAMFGLAVGDALGTTLEFKPPGTFDPIDDMVGGGPFRLEPGEWTDDTSMAMCLAESLLARQGFDEVDQMDRYRQWYRAGYWSCRDECFDIGTTVRAAVELYEQTHNGYCGSNEKHTAGNGSLMRLAPIPLYFARTPREAIDRARDSSRTTHGVDPCLDACRYYASLILGALNNVDKTTLLSGNYAVVEGLWENEPLCEEIAEIAAGSFKRKQPPEIRGSGYVVQSLEAALWAFHQSDNFRDGALKAVNLGDDADTTGAIYGQLAGAYYGYFEIPDEWSSKIAWEKQIRRLTQHLYKAAVTRNA